jgi:hypothetical protein
MIDCHPRGPRSRLRDNSDVSNDGEMGLLIICCLAPVDVDPCVAF